MAIQGIIPGTPEEDGAGLDGGGDHFSIVVLRHARLVHRHCAALHRLLERVARVIHPEGEIANAVTMTVDVIRDELRVVAQVRSNRRGENEADLVLLQYVAGTIAGAGFRSAIGNQVEAESGAVVEGRLLGVPHVKLYVIGSVDREDILGSPGIGHRLRCHC